VGRCGKEGEGLKAVRGGGRGKEWWGVGVWSRLSLRNER